MAIEFDAFMRRAAGKNLDRRSFIQAALATGLSFGTATGLWSKAARSAPAKGGLFTAGLDDGNTTKHGSGDHQFALHDHHGAYAAQFPDRDRS